MNTQNKTMSRNKQLTIYKSINETIAFYFETIEGGSGNFNWSLMCPVRMAYIFDRGLKSGKLTPKRKFQVTEWFALMKENKINITEDFPE